MDLHANAFSETLSQTVQKDIEPGIEPVIVPENKMGQEIRTVIGTETHDRSRPIAPNVKLKIAPNSAPRVVIHWWKGTPTFARSLNISKLARIRLYRRAGRHIQI